MSEQAPIMGEIMQSGLADAGRVSIEMVGGEIRISQRIGPYWGEPVRISGSLTVEFVRSIVRLYREPGAAGAKRSAYEPPIDDLPWDGQRVCAMMARLGMEKDELARICGVSIDTVKEWRNNVYPPGIKNRPTLLMLEQRANRVSE